jgi:glycosyltransferase involved in cell wall biosynthesis
VRILLISPGLGLGGSERLTLTYARGLEARGHRTLIAHGPPEGLSSIVEAAGVEHRLVHRKRLGVRTLRPWLRALRALVRDFEPDLIHAQSTRTSLVSALVAPRVPLLSTVHGIEPSEERLAALLLRASRARVTAVSQASADGILRYRLSPPIRVLPPGVDVAELERAGKAAPSSAISPRRPLVVCVARHDPVKGVDVLVEAFPDVLSAIPEAGLQLVGGGEDHARLIARAAELGLGDAIEFTGFQPNPTPYLAAADLVVLPSRREGLPVSALEAFALAKPLVATAVGGTPDLVRDGDTGWLVPAEQPSALAAAIVEALEDPAECARRAAHGHELVARTYSIDVVVDQLDELCRSLAPQRGSGRDARLSLDR